MVVYTPSTRVLHLGLNHIRLNDSELDRDGDGSELGDHDSETMEEPFFIAFKNPKLTLLENGNMKYEI